MTDEKILMETDRLLSDFYINVRQIENNSDNTFEDIRQEAIIIVTINPKVIKNRREFINNLKTSCLKFNKYGKRIEDKERWLRFNNYEANMVRNAENKYDIDEDRTCKLVAVKEEVGDKDYEFLIDYYSYGGKKTAELYGMTEACVRKKANNLVHLLREKLV